MRFAISCLLLACSISAADVPQLQWTAVFGGSGGEAATELAVGADGSVYIAGRTTSANLPQTRVLDGNWNSYGPMLAADAYVTKFAPDGRTIVWSVYLGGTLSEQVHGLALDAAGNAYVLGYTTSYLFPTTPGAMQQYLAGTGDYFVVKLDSATGNIVYATLLGTPSLRRDDSMRYLHLAVDPAGHAYIVGNGPAEYLPTTLGALQRAGRDGVGYALKLNTAGTAPVYATFFGGDSGPRVESIDLDPRGSLLIAGALSTTAEFPAVNPLPQTGTQPPYNSAFAAKINPSGSAIEFSTVLPFQRSAIQPLRVAFDSRGAAWIAGQSADPKFPVVAPVEVGVPAATLPAASEQVFLMRIAPEGGALESSTLLWDTGLTYASQLRMNRGSAPCLFGGLRFNAPFTSGAPLPAHPWSTQNGIVCTGTDARRFELISPALSPIVVSVVKLGLDGAAYFAGTGDVDHALPAAVPQTDYRPQGPLCPYCGYTDAGIAKFALAPRTPVLNVLSPSVVTPEWGSDTIEGAEVTLYGRNFGAGSTVLWNGTAVKPALQTDNQLVIRIPERDLVPGAVAVRVDTGGLVSNELQLEVHNPYPDDVYILPASVQAGSDDVKVAIRGDISPHSRVLWNGAVKPAVMKGLSLEFVLTAAELKSPGMVEVRLENPAPGGGRSPAAWFAINPADPAVSLRYVQANPVAIRLPLDAKPLAITGDGFSPAAVVLWNGEPRATTRVDAKKLEWTPLPADFARWGTAQVSVRDGNWTSVPVPAYIGGRLTATHLVYDPRARLVYALAYTGNDRSVWVVDPVAGKMDQVALVHKHAQEIVLSEDGTWLWVRRFTGGQIDRIHLPSRTIDLSFDPTGLADSGRVEQFFAVPGSPRSLVVSTGYATEIWDDAVRRPYTSTRWDILAVTHDRIHGRSRPWQECSAGMSFDAAGIRDTVSCEAAPGPDPLVQSDHGFHWFLESGVMRALGYDRVAPTVYRDGDSNRYTADLRRRRAYVAGYGYTGHYMYTFDLDTGSMLDIRTLPDRYASVGFQWLPEVGLFMFTDSTGIYFIPAP